MKAIQKAAAMTRPETALSTINIADVRTNGGTQSRAAINRDTVAEYAEALETGAAFPPIVVFFDGAAYWLADGFHRYEAYARAKTFEVVADVRQGTQRDAILYSVGANADHGLRRTNEDKRRAALTLLNDPEWSAWPLAKIAAACRVSIGLVHKLQADAVSFHGEKIAKPDERTVQRAGSTYTMNTAAIGRPAPAPSTTLVDAEPNAEALPAPLPVLTDPAEARVRREISRLSPDGMVDEIVGLRADLAEIKARAAALRVERDDLKARLAEATAGDQGVIIAKLQKQYQAAKYARDEAMAATKRMEYRLKKAEARVQELETLPIMMRAS